MSELFRFEAFVNQRHHSVHQQDGERDTLGVRSKEVDDDGEQTTTTSKHDHAPRGGRGGHHISSHETSTEDETAGKQVDERADINFGVHQVEDAGNHKRRGNKRHGDVPGDDALPQQEGCTNEQGDSGHLTEAAAHLSDEHIHVGRHLAQVATLLDEAEGRRTRHRVGETPKRSRHRPRGHLHRERDEQHDTCHQCGVERVVTQP